jgi:hypothetical protein
MKRRSRAHAPPSGPRLAQSTARADERTGRLHRCAAQVWIAPTALSSAEIDGYIVLSNTAAGLIARTDMCACADEPLTQSAHSAEAAQRVRD